MFGVIVNSLAIFFGGLLGLIINKGIPKRLDKSIMDGLALVVIYMGISGALKGDNPLYVIVSMTIGIIIGELIDIDNLLNKLGSYLNEKFSKKNILDSSEENKISKGFVSSSLLFCVGAMAVVGSIQSGLSNDNSVLLAKSVLDGISSIFFAASMGVGVLLSSIAVFLYEGIITIGASGLSNILSTSVITYMTCVGSLLIMAMGLNMIKACDIKVANMLPAMFIPIIMGIFNII
ncbi:putative membrane protein YdfK [Terrisporobacter petrolearius]|uniref:Membrane protein YdfK n=1 Tax=Terrisporobacter petrolearius TaxID=1460447 RepID=A0ABZ3FDE6_9FIRM